jgi:hypothetical protein
MGEQRASTTDENPVVDSEGAPPPAGTWKIDLKLDMQSGLGISLVAQHELVYLSSADIQLTLSGDKTTQSLDLSVQNIQIDDQTVRDDSNAVILYPQVRTGAVAAPPPIFQLTVARSFEGGEKAVILKQLEIDIQPFCLRVKEELLLRVLALAPSLHWGAAAAAAASARNPAAVAASESAADLVATTAQSYSIGEVEQQAGAWRSTYFESLKLHQMKVTAGYEKAHRQLSDQLEQLKRQLGIGLYPQFEGAVIELETFALDRPFADLGTVCGLRQNVTLEGTNGSHACSLEARTCV